VITVVKGPCLCGDPYCGSCGDPSLAALEESEQALYDKLHEIKADIDFYHLLTAISPALKDSFEKAVNDRVMAARSDDEMYISHLRDRVDVLEEREQERR